MWSCSSICWATFYLILHQKRELNTLLLFSIVMSVRGMIIIPLIPYAIASVRIGSAQRGVWHWFVKLAWSFALAFL